ncbi:MAG: hypothetical protein U0228_08625 [Myxococcaceae bacterium]
MLATVALLALSLGQSPAVDSQRDSQRDTPKDDSRWDLAPQKADDAISFDQAPSPAPHLAEDGRVRRFLGAFAAGAVGYGGMLALAGAATDTACLGCGATAGQIVLSLFAPVVSVVASWATFSLMGGNAGFVTPWISFVPSALLGLILTAVAADMGASGTVGHLPYAVAAGVFLSGFSAMALDVRHQQLGELGAASTWGAAEGARVAVESLVSAVSIASGAFISALFAFSLLPVAVTLAVVQSFGAAAAVWGVHTAMRGKGSFLAALAAFGVAGAVAAGATAATFLISGRFDPFNTASAAVIAMDLLVAGSLFFPTIILELSHTSNVAARLPRFTMSAAPVREGGVVTAGLVF